MSKSPGGFLIVDDIAINIYVTQEMLLHYGAPIDTAESGQEAIEKIKQGNEYDIIFMDHMMPGMNGIEATEIIRSTGYTGCIIALTANAPGENDRLYLAGGFNRFISKPIDLDELDDIVYQYVELDYAEDWDDEEEYDTAEVNEYFIMDATHAIEVLEELYAQPHTFTPDEIDTYETTVHGIKSALRNIGRQELADHALRLEEAAKAGNIAVMNSETNELIEDIKDLIEELRAL